MIKFLSWIFGAFDNFCLYAKDLVKSMAPDPVLAKPAKKLDHRV